MCDEYNVKVPEWFYSVSLCDCKVLTVKQIEKIQYEYCRLGKACFLEFAKKNNILPYVAHVLSYCCCDVNYWNEIHQYYKDRSKRIVQLLDKVFIEFNNVGVVDVCVSENFGSVLSADTCLGCFCSGDVDFYCQRNDIDKIDAVLTKLGFVWDDRFSKKKQFVREYKNLDAIGEEFWFNFQWRPITRKKTQLYDPRYIMKRFPKLFEETEHYSDTAIKIFKPEVALYLNCLHIASGHFYVLMPKIRLYVDIDRPIRYREIDWDKFKSFVLEDRLGLRTDVVISISNILLKTPVSEDFSVSSEIKRGKLINKLVNKEERDFKVQKPGRISRIWFLISTELLSDGGNVFLSFLKRLWVIVSFYN